MLLCKKDFLRSIKLGQKYWDSKKDRKGVATV